MRNKLLKSLKTRIAYEAGLPATLKFLRQLVIEDVLDDIIANTYLYTRPKKGSDKQVIMSEVVSVIGHGLRRNEKKDSMAAARVGTFVFYSFYDLGLVLPVMTSAANGHGTYIIEVLDEKSMQELWEGVSRQNGRGKLPSATPYSDWTGFRHETGAILVKTQSRYVADILKPAEHPIVFESINRSQKVGWQINREVYTIAKWALSNKTEAFSDIWEQHNPQAKTTKLRETKAILSIADKFLDTYFYHLYYLDFRGRKYPTTAYLHEQSSDIAKGLLLRKDKKVIGQDGFFWLCISIANNWAGSSGREDNAKTDKIPLKDRYQWVLDNKEILVSYAVSPKLHQGWMEADKPWQLLAACIELKNALALGPEYLHYESHIECFIDGSTNGSQHLSALTRDEVTAPYVNLVPLDMPGDLYSYVAIHVWTKIATIVDAMPPETVLKCEEFIDNLISLKKKISAAAPKSELRAELVTQIRAYKGEYSFVAERAAPVFWHRIKDVKQRRKIVKRNVMTLPYGGSGYGLAEQQIDDATKHGIELLMNIEHRWASWMGRLVYEDAKESLERPMQLLGVFERAGARAEKLGDFLEWQVPVTNFPVIQHYTEGKTKRIHIEWGPRIGERLLTTKYFPNDIQLHICFIEEQVPSKGKQSQGAAPNVIHSLDAAHLALTTVRCDFPITTIHDSYGCLLADMPKLYRIVRETFVELYADNPLFFIIDQVSGTLEALDMGDLDIDLILESEYAFA
jgi:DNA-directed RNA polymerase